VPLKKSFLESDKNLTYFGVSGILDIDGIERLIVEFLYILTQKTHKAVLSFILGASSLYYQDKLTKSSVRL